MSHAHSIVLCSTFMGLMACGHGRPLAPPAAPLTEPTRLCAQGETPPACQEPALVESLLASSQLKVLGAALPPGGDQGTQLLTVSARASDGEREHIFRAKWRGPSTSGVVNEPRKELAAYAVQKLFLDPGEYVAPPTAAHCFDRDSSKDFSTTADEPLPGTDCILGFLSLWLEDVKTVDGARKAGWLEDGEAVWCPKLFDSDPGYKTSIAQANLFMYAVNHGDPHPGQFILERASGGTRIYVVDNSIAFRSIKNPKILFEPDWSGLLAPAYPARTLERIRALTDDDFAALGLIDEFEWSAGEMVRRAKAAGPPVASGLDWDGKVLRIGLTPGEIELVRARLRALGERTDLATF